jgi:NADH-quinone oxidoreductase subunit G
LALRALDNTGFIVSLEQRVSAVTDRADVVLPVAVVAQKTGTFVNWEGRGRHFDTALKSSGVMSDLRVLNALAGELDAHLGLPGPEAARAELAELGAYKGTRPEAPNVSGPVGREPGPGEALLATWRLLLDNGRLQDGEPFLAGTAKIAVARVSAATAEENGLNEKVTVSTASGAITLPVEITPDLPDRVVWVPAHSDGSSVTRDLAAVSGDIVRIDGGAA